MPDAHWIRKKRGTWIIAVPPHVRKLLGVTHRMQLYWHIARKGEAVLAVGPQRLEGQPPIRQLTRELAAKTAEVDAIRHRDETRDRGMYAEGFAHGYIQAYERLVTPHGPSAERGHRRARYRWAHPNAAQLVDPKQAAPRPAPDAPRPNARTRRAKRDAREPVREVEEVAAPVLEAPALVEQS